MKAKKEDIEMISQKEIEKELERLEELPNTRFKEGVEYALLWVTKLYHTAPYDNIKGD